MHQLYQIEYKQNTNTDIVEPGGRVGVVSLVLDQSFNREKQKAFLVGFVF